MRYYRIILAGTAGATLLLMPFAPVAEAASCTATVHASPRGDQVMSDYTLKTWGLDIDAKIDAEIQCAKVYFDMTVTERLFSGEEITTTERMFRKTSAPTSSFKIEHKIAKDSTVSGSSFKVVRCVVCGTE